MRKYIFLSLMAILALPLFTFADGYCGHGSYGLNVFTSAAVYERGQVVNFCLQDDTRIPLFIGAGQPWQIVDKHGRVVYQPYSPPVITQPDATWTFFGTWDGLNAKGNLVPPGEYQVQFNLSNTPSASFTIRPHL
jgi:hypothetical protein